MIEWQFLKFYKQVNVTVRMSGGPDLGFQRNPSSILGVREERAINCATTNRIGRGLSRPQFKISDATAR